MPGRDRGNAGPNTSGAGSGTGGLNGPSPTATIKGDAEVIRHLNRILKNELTAINQYFLHSRILADWGLSELAEYVYHESIDEMKHADKLIKRVLFLGGLPNLQDLGKLLIGESVEEVIQCDLRLEEQSYPDLKEAIAHCEKVRDYGSRDVFEDILESEEKHIDWLQTQLRLIAQMGIQNYVQLQTKANDAP